MSQLPQHQNLSQLQSKWKSALDPVLANLLVQGQLLSNINLINGTTAISHKLGRKPNGWFLVSPLGAAMVYQAASQSNPTLSLSLTSNAAIITSIWVF